MRQLKTFLRNRKAEMLWCGPCECRTLQCWRYANENCGCAGDTTLEPGYYTLTFSLSNAIETEPDYILVPAESQDPLWGSIAQPSVKIPVWYRVDLRTISDRTQLVFSEGTPWATEITVEITPNEWYYCDFPEGRFAPWIIDYDTWMILGSGVFPIAFFEW